MRSDVIPGNDSANPATRVGRSGQLWRRGLREGGPAFNVVPFDPAKVVPVPVGTVTLTFIDGNTATFAYSVNGVAQTKQITREVFGPPGTVCHN